MSNVMPTVFVSHGAPSLLSEKDETYRFLQTLGGLLPRPKSIVCVSAHWEAPAPTVTTHRQPPTIHDFYGFPEELYSIQYPAPGDPDLAGRVAELLHRSGVEAVSDPSRGLDHGAWVPLLLAYPSADIPVVQVSVQTSLGPAHHWRMGRAVAPLRREGVLILGSGGATHNLRELGGFDRESPPAFFAREFDTWLHQAISEANEPDLLDYENRAPHASRNHPTAEHFLPLFVPLGAGGPDPGRRIHEGFAYRALSMAAYAWGI